MKSIVFISLLLLLTGRIAAAPPHYHVTDLGGKDSAAYGSNDRGEIVGITDARPFLWRNGKVQQLGVNAIPLGINNRSQIIGSLIVNAGTSVATWKPYTRAFVLQKDVVKNLGILPGGVFASSAKSLNDNGEIVGDSSTSGYNHAFLYRKDRMIDLGVPLGYDTSRAFAINSWGCVAGCASLTSGLSPSHVDAFLWQYGHWKLLGRGMRAVALDDKADVACTRTTQNGVSTLLWKKGKWRSLGGFDAEAMNNSGQVIGASISQGVKPRKLNNTSGFQSARTAVLWQDGVLYRLNNLVPVSGWDFTDARNINSHGQIVGFGIHNGKTHAFLLTPITK